MRLIDLTVLMGVHNGERWIKKSIDSVLLNSGINYELIIVNDGSSDNTKKILESFRDSRIRIFHEEHSGLTKSLNFGLQKARGKFIARIDADDICHSTRFRKQIDYLNSNKKLDLVGSNAELIDMEGLHQGYAKYPKDFQSLTNNLNTFKSIFPHSSIMFKKDVVLSLGGYNERFFRAQDYDLYLRLSEKHHFECIQEPLIKLRLNEKGPTLTDENQVTYGIAALICFNKRKLNLYDPSSNNDNHWKFFFEEVKLWAKKNNIYDIISYKRNLRLLRIAYNQRKYSKMIKLLLKKLLINPSYFFKKKLIGDLPNDIAGFLK